MTQNGTNSDEVMSSCHDLRVGNASSATQAGQGPYTATAENPYTGKELKKVYSSNFMKWVNPNSNCGSQHEPCKSPRCLTCPSFQNSPLFTSTVNGTNFILTQNQSFSCKSKNVIYLITCGKCNIQYVGKTTTALHKRINGHRITANNDCSNLFIAQHFTQEGHEFSNAHIQIIDAIEEGNNDTKFVLTQKEDFWINTLCTAYPLGLNDNIRQFGNVSQGNIGDAYFTKSKVPRRNRGHGKRKNKKSPPIDRQFLNDKLALLQNNFEMGNKIVFYQTLRSLRKIQLLALRRHHFVHSAEDMDDILRSFTNNLLKAKTDCPNVNANNSKQDREVLLIPFISKAIDSLKLKSLFLDRKIQNLLPKKVHDHLPLSLRYSFDIPIGRKICNYSTILKDLNQQKLKEYIANDCECCPEDEHFYEPHGHIISGDLSLVENPLLRDLMLNGTKYREPRFVSLADLKTSIMSSVEYFINKLCSKFNLSLNEFNVWRTKIQTVLFNRMSFYNSHKPWLFTESKSRLILPDVKKELERLHNKYVICSVDKASNNYVFVCKKYYITILLKELGIDITTFACKGNQTYSPIIEQYDDIVERHCKTMESDFGITVNEQNKVLPRIFWNPKLHKIPYKARFIAGATLSTTKPLSRLLTKALQVLLKQFKNDIANVFTETPVSILIGVSILQNNFWID